MKKIATGRDQMGSFAPKFASLNDDVLFGEVWSREDRLSPRDRSLITISALMTSGILDSSLKNHIAMGKEHGISEEEISEALTQLAFYAGWPKLGQHYAWQKRSIPSKKDDKVHIIALSSFL